jgi:hypothetical protein
MLALLWKTKKNGQTNKQKKNYNFVPALGRPPEEKFLLPKKKKEFLITNF